MGKKRPAGGIARKTTSDEAKGLRGEAVQLKEVVDELTLESRPLKLRMTGDGGDDG